MSTAKAIFSLGMFVFWICMAGYFAHHIYVLQVVEPAELAKEDAVYLAHGCTIDADGQEYTCPNGLPPADGEVEIESPKSQVSESSAKTDPSMPGCTVTGEDNTGKANSWSCP